MERVRTATESGTGATYEAEAGARTVAGAQASAIMVIDGLSRSGEPQHERKNLNKDQKDRLFNLLWETGLHHPSKPKIVKETCLIIQFIMKEENNSDNVKKLCVIPNISVEKAEKEKTNDGHAERLLFAWIRKNREKLVSKDLTIYTNYSPCKDCCNDINSFCEENDGFKMEFICSQLYYIRRPSCKDRKPKCECHSMLENKKWGGESLHDLMIKALKNLHKCVKVLPSKAVHWKNLRKLLTEYTSDQGATPSDQGATPSDQEAAPSDQGATPSDQGVTPGEDELTKVIGGLSLWDNNIRENKEDEMLYKDFVELKLLNKPTN